MLKDHDQFILATITPEGTKLPVDAAGNAINAHDPANWMNHDAAKALADITGYLLSFVISEADPYFCIDIDHCLMPDGRSWSPLAQKVVQQFAGARIEVSYSGKGLHVWGQCSHFPPHSCKNVKEGLELYHEKRFIILGHYPQGEEDGDHAVALRGFVDEYLPPRNRDAHSNTPYEWTFEPVPEWAGPEDDDALIERMCAGKGTRAMFRDDKCTFEDLWLGNDVSLSKAFPDHSGLRLYDASSADMSMAQHLAYWTGKNCERMRNIMQRSALVREKWEDRPDYLRRTILNACSMQKTVYVDGSLPFYATKAGEDRRMTRGWVDTEDIPRVFHGCVYIRSEHAVLAPGCDMPLPPPQFDTHYGGFIFALDDQKTTRRAFEAFTQCPAWAPPEADYTCFRPRREFGEIIDESGKTYVNTYRPVVMCSRAGDVSRFTKLLSANFTKMDREILLSWMATVVQNPGVKLQWAPLLQGPEGNGKSFILSCLRKALTEGYCHPLNARDIEGNACKFTGWMEGKLLVTVEEIRAGQKHEVVQSMLTWISEDRIEIQAKGKGQKSGDNYANFIFTSNFFDALTLRADQRRFCPLASKPQNYPEIQKAGLTPAFFKDLWDWAKGEGQYAGRTPGYHHITHYLQNYDVQEAFDPLGACNRAPRSTYYDDFFAAATGRIEQEIIEAIDQGVAGFRGGWVSGAALDALLMSKRMAHKVPHTRRTEILKQLGYDPHPGLKAGRATRPVMPDGTRSKLYIKRGHYTAEWTDPGPICGAYTEAQTSADGANAKLGVNNYDKPPLRAVT